MDSIDSMAPFRFFQKTLVLILAVFLQCISISNAQSSNEVNVLNKQFENQVNVYLFKTLCYNIISVLTVTTQSNQPQCHSFLQLSTSSILNTQEATSEITDGSSTFSTTLPPSTTTEIVIAADRSSKFRKVNVQVFNSI